MISEELLNEAYSCLEAKYNEITHALTDMGYALESGWYNGHYQKNPEGQWVRDAYPIPVVTVKGLCDIEIQFEGISVSTRLKREAALANSFGKLMEYRLEAYGVEDYLSDYYHAGQTEQEMKECIRGSAEKEIGFSFLFPFETEAKRLLALVKLLGQEGFYH